MLMKYLLYRVAPPLGLLALLAVALACLLYLFQLFVGLTPSGGDNLSAVSSSLDRSFEVPSGASLVDLLAAVTCMVLGAGIFLLSWRWLRDRPETPRWVMVCGAALAVATVGLGLYLLFGGTTQGSLPSATHQVTVGEIEPLALTVLATMVLAVMLVGVTKPPLLIPLLGVCLVAILVSGLLVASPIRSLDLFEDPARLSPEAGDTGGADALRERGPSTGPQNQELADEDLSETLTTRASDSDELTPPVDHSSEAPATSDGGASWPMWVGLLLTAVAGLVAAYVLVRRRRSLARLLLLLLAVCLVAILLLGLLMFSPIRGPNLFGQASPWGPDVGNAGGVDALHEQGSTTGPSGQELGGVATSSLATLEGEDRSETLTTRESDSDASDSPADRSSEAPATSDDGFNWLLWIGLPLAAVIGFVAVCVLVRQGRSFMRWLRRAGGLVLLLWGGLVARRRADARPDKEEERAPALLHLSFPNLPTDGEKVWQVGERVSLLCVLTGELGEPISRVRVQLDWGDAEEPGWLTTDWKGRCTATWSARKEGVYRVTASFVGDEHYLPVTAVEEFRVRAHGRTATHLDITLVKPAEDLPFIWGTGEPVHVDVRLLDDAGAGMGGRTVTVGIGEPGLSIALLTDADGRCHTSWTGTVPGTYRVVADFAGEGEYLPTSARHGLEVVDFRDDVVRRYNSFLPWAREKEPGISDQTTPREMELMVVAGGTPIDHRALEVLIARFEEADYSQHDIDRPRFEAMYRACRKIVEG